MKKGFNHLLLSSAVVVSLIAGGCGSGAPAKAPDEVGSTVSGIAASGEANSVVSLKDSSQPAREKRTSAGSDGFFAIDVSDLTPPYVLKAEWKDEYGDKRLHSLSAQGGTANINAITDAAVAAAAEGTDPGALYAAPDLPARHRAAGRLGSTLSALQTALAPLFERYQVNGDLLTEAGATRFSGLRALLRDVRFSVNAQTFTATNRATGGIIYSSPLSDLASGTLQPENMPGGSEAAPAACVYSYSAWDSCQPDGSQTRAVTASSPAGCTGAPELSQSCTYAPPAPDACTYTYSAWGACEANGTQTRAVSASSPAGCSGTPVLTQSCSYVPPAPDACSYTYSAWGTCEANGTQTRTVSASSPTGCTGTPVLTQACTYSAPLDGEAIFQANCASCHGTKYRGASASSIKSAIDANKGGMGSTSLRSLTQAELEAIDALQ